MPRVLEVAGETPVNVEAASRAFGLPVRIHLIRHYLHSPGSQTEAAAALGVSQRAVSINTRLLMELGVVRTEPSAATPGARVYSVDPARLHELQAALRHFIESTATS